MQLRKLANQTSGLHGMHAYKMYFFASDHHPPQKESDDGWRTISPAPPLSLSISFFSSLERSHKESDDDDVGKTHF